MCREIDTYVVASSAPFAAMEFERRVERLSGNWVLATAEDQISEEYLTEISPRYAFFPHWSHRVPKSVIEKWECIGFHATDLPFGRGGTPIQNLIERGFEQTTLTAFRMTEEIDAGPVYLKRDVSLSGLAEEIYLRISSLAFDMIVDMIAEPREPVPQAGDIVVFNRRTPEQSVIALENMEGEKQLFDFIRMLDAEGYPRATLEIGDWIIEFERPALRLSGVKAEVTFRRKTSR